MVRGSCLCGGVRFELGEVRLVTLCHCSMCRKSGGAPFEVAAVVPVEDYRLAEGAERIESYESSPGMRRTFCRVCGSRTTFEAPDGAHVLVPAGLLDDDPVARPALHMFVGSKAPWWEIRDDLPQFAEWVPGYGPGDPA